MKSLRGLRYEHGMSFHRDFITFLAIKSYTQCFAAMHSFLKVTHLMMVI